MIKFVNTEALNLRNGPGTKYYILGILNIGQEVEVIQEGSNWSKVQALGKIGFVASSYLSDKNPIDIKNRIENIIKFAKSKIGSTYVYGAEGPNTFDCSGFVKYVFEKSISLNLPRTSIDQSKFGEYIKLEELKLCDLMFFDTDLDGKVNHVGIYIENNSFIHASTSKKQVIISEIAEYYKLRFVNGRRILK